MKFPVPISARTIHRRRDAQRNGVRTKNLAALALAGILLSACSPELITKCEDQDGFHAVCGLIKPEDMAVLEGGRHVIVSQYGSMDGEHTGDLAILDLVTETHQVLFSGGSSEHRAAPGWGSTSCPGPLGATFSPHGIDLSRRGDGRWQLLVVNHGGRESVEFFEIASSRDDQGGTSATLPLIQWRGCVTIPPGTTLNDVVALPDGGFLATKMYGSYGLILDSIRGQLFGSATGHVLEWQPATGLHPVRGTEAPFPNGIEVSDDGRDIYLAVYIAGEIRRISRATGEILGRGKVKQPDNVTWARNGHLLIASHVGGTRDFLACDGLAKGACPMAFAIAEMDPETMETRTVLEHEGAPMGAATVAVDLGERLLLGSFAGDRAVITPWKATSP